MDLTYSELIIILLCHTTEVKSEITCIYAETLYFKSFSQGFVNTYGKFKGVFVLKINKKYKEFLRNYKGIISFYSFILDCEVSVSNGADLG